MCARIHLCCEIFSLRQVLTHVLYLVSIWHEHLVVIPRHGINHGGDAPTIQTCDALITRREMVYCYILAALRSVLVILQWAIDKRPLIATPTAELVKVNSQLRTPI